MQAVCFTCGEYKKTALKMCPRCHAIPHTRDDQIASVALSADCIRLESIERASDYIKRKRRLPRFHDSVTSKAVEIIDEMVLVNDSNSTQSFEFSTSFFDFGDLISDSGELPQSITVHAIGKPQQVALDEFGAGAIHKTYHTLEWEIGNDIPSIEVENNMHHDGCLYVWYRWRENRWQRKCVTKTVFDQLMNIEKQ